MKNFKILLFLIMVLNSLSACSFIEKTSFYEIFINPEIKNVIIESGSESIIPDIESVPENGDLE